jgi:hypothetical protein
MFRIADIALELVRVSELTTTATFLIDLPQVFIFRSLKEPAFEIPQGRGQKIMGSDFCTKVLRQVRVARDEVENSLSADARRASTSCHG